MKVYTYHVPIELFPIQNKLIDNWSTSWKKNGFEPIVLTDEDAKKHSRYDELYKEIQQIRANVNHRKFDARGEKYSISCYLRWLAYAALDSSERFYTCDYDILNFNFKPGDEQSDKFHLMDHFCPGIVSTTSAQCDEFIQAFVKISNDRTKHLNHLARRNKMFWYNDQDFVEHNMDHLEEYGYDWKISPRGTYSTYPNIDTTSDDELCLVHFDHQHTHHCFKAVGKEKFYLDMNQQLCRATLMEALITGDTIRNAAEQL